MKKLFDDISRDFLGPAGHNEETFHYYQRSARKDISTIRDKLNDWFIAYPDNEQFELSRRFKKDFDAAFYELYLYVLFKNLGFKIEIHPTVKDSAKRPDFLIRKDDIEIYVEAKVVYDQSSEESAVKRKVSEFYDQLDKIRCPGFLLYLHTLNFKTDKQPSSKKAVEYIEEEVSKLDPRSLEEKLNHSFNTRDLPVIEFENHEVHIIVKPMPMSETAREKESNMEIEDKRAIGMYPVETILGGGRNSLKSAINQKAKRYGELDKPFIICLNSLASKGTIGWNAESAVWGQFAFSWSVDPDNRNERLVRNKDGVFLDHKGPRLKNVSGVFISRVSPYTIPSPEYHLFQNPFAYFKIEFSTLMINMQKIEDGKIIVMEGQRFEDIIGVKEDWLD